MSKLEQYSWKWGWKIYEQFQNTYSFADCYLRGLFGIDAHTIVEWLITKKLQDRWERYKKAVKYTQRTYSTYEKHYEGDTDVVDSIYRRILHKDSKILTTEWRQSELL